MKLFAKILKNGSTKVDLFSKIRKEDQLILLCCETDSDPNISEKIEMLLEKNLDWNYILDTIINHKYKNRGSILLYLKLRTNHKVPDYVRQLLTQIYYQIIARIIYYKNEFEKVLPTIKKYNEIILLRGVFYLYTIYKNNIIREPGDIDLLIDKKICFSFADADHEYVPETVRNSIDVEIEYHYNFNSKTPAFGPCTYINMKEFWQRSKVITINDIDVRILEPEDYFLHVSHHNIIKGFVCLYRFVDLKEFIKKYNLNWNSIIERGRKYNLLTAIWLNCYVVNSLFDDEIVSENIMMKVKPGILKEWIILKLVDFDILHDPNTNKDSIYSSGLNNFKKQLLVRIPFIRIFNFHKFLLYPLKIPFIKFMYSENFLKKKLYNLYAVFRKIM
jgi:hypothetical protein